MVYSNSNKFLHTQRKLTGKYLIEVNGYPLIKINNEDCEPFKIALWELSAI
jgi:hypothetical protein